jgi:hypothetical protein
MAGSMGELPPTTPMLTPTSKKHISMMTMVEMVPMKHEKWI